MSTKVGPKESVEVSWTRYRLANLPGDRPGIRLIDPEANGVVAVIEEVSDGWAIQLHPSGTKLRPADLHEDLDSAIRRADDALAAERETAPSTTRAADLARDLYDLISRRYARDPELVERARALADLYDIERV